MDKMDTTPLKRIINERGLKNKWIAEQVRVEESAISQIANGKRKPGIAKAIRIARLLDTTVEDLFGYIADEDGKVIK